MKVLIVSASMGAGHDGAARELARRLDADAHETRVVDLLDAPPLKIGAAFRWGYKAQLRYAPWAYELTYKLWYWLGILIAPATAFVHALTGRKLLRWVRDLGPDVVVSTYPLASLALGRERQRGRLRVPVVTFVTDFAVHPLLVHRAVDLHQCVHPQSAAKASARNPHGRVSAPGPLVSPRFRDGAAARYLLGIEPSQLAVLIVAGSWGVGDIVEAFDLLAASERFTPVVVCGRNEKLARQLRTRGGGVIIEWTDEMPALMRACDALVQNAGGLTCMEAFAAGLPVVTFKPIPGHGIENAEDMDRAGVAPYVRRPQELLATLDEVVTGPRRAAAVAAGHAMFAADPAAEIVDVGGRAPLVVPLPARRSRVRVAAAAAVAFYATFTYGVGVAAAHGVGVAHARRGSGVAYVAVRLSAQTAADSGVTEQLARLPASAVIDQDTVEANPGAVVQLRAAGIEVANGGSGDRFRLEFERAARDIGHTNLVIRRATGQRADVFVASRRVNGYDLVAARLAHERVIVGRQRVTSANAAALRLRPGWVYVVDGRALDGPALTHLLSQLVAKAASQHVVTQPVGRV